MGVYDDTLNDIENTLGAVPGLMKFFPKEKLVHDWLSWKSLGEIDLERARYLLSTDEMVEKMLSETQGNVVLTPIKPSVAAAQEESA